MQKKKNESYQFKVNGIYLFKVTAYQPIPTKIKRIDEKLNNELMNYTMKIKCPSQNTAFTKAEYK